MAAPMRRVHGNPRMSVDDVVDLLMADEDNIDDAESSDDDRGGSNVISVTPVISFEQSFQLTDVSNINDIGVEDMSDSEQSDKNDPSYTPGEEETTEEDDSMLVSGDKENGQKSDTKVLEQTVSEPAVEKAPLVSSATVNRDNVGSPVASTSKTFEVLNDTALPTGTSSDEERELHDQEQTVQRSRKRKRADPSSWIRNVRKRARAKGEEYVTRKGKRIQAKKLNFVFPCRSKCNQKIPLDEAERLNRQHLDLADKNIQQAVIIGLTSNVPVQQRCTKVGDKFVKVPANEDAVLLDSRHSYTYNIKRENGSLISVCKKHFCEVYATTTRELVRIHKLEGSTVMDKRKGRKAPNLTEPEVKKLIEDHIDSFPRMSSHYSRNKNPNRRYLNPNLGSVRQMWVKFLEKHEPDKADEVKNNTKYIYVGQFKEWLYREVFNELNLSIGFPRTDTCAQCDKFVIAHKDAEANGGPADTIREEYDLHLAQGDAGYEAKRRDKHLSRSSWGEDGHTDEPKPPHSQDATDMYTFDYKKNFLIPNLRHNDIYYQRQLCIYLFGIHDCVRKTSQMYYYPESEAKKGGSEVSSMVYDALCRAKTGAKKCIFYTDGCGGQNRNRDVMTMFQALTDDPEKKLFDQIDHKILLRGHTRLPNDSDFAKIDAAEECAEIHLPSEYGALIQGAVRQKGRFVAIEAKQEMIFDLKKLCKETRKTTLKDIDNNRVLISRHRWFSYGQSQEVVWESNGPKVVSHDHPGEVWMKKTLDDKEPWTKVPTKKRNGPLSTDFSPKYDGRKMALKKAKWDDLQKISEFLPQEKRGYYNGLLYLGHDSNADDSDGSDSGMDFD